MMSEGNLKSDFIVQELPLTDQSSTSSDSFYVRSHFRKRSKSAPLSHLKKKNSTKPTMSHHLMDPATFKLVLETQKQNLADVKERQKKNKSNSVHKSEWKNFFSTKKKRRRGKARYVWETKRNKQHQAEMDFIKSIHNLKIPMDTDQYEISDTKKAMVTDNDTCADSTPDTTLKSSMDVDIDLDSEPEGDDTMTIASLMEGQNINIDSPKKHKNERQTQMESPTQLFEDSDHSDTSDNSDDDEGEFLFKE
jgi:hypothetical protein